MRVSHVITRLIIGGAQENTVSSVLGLRARHGVECTLISGPTTGPEGTIEPLVSEIPSLLTLVPTLVRPVRPWLDLRAQLALTKIFRDQRPDIVTLTAARPACSVGWPRAARMCRSSSIPSTARRSARSKVR